MEARLHVTTNGLLLAYQHRHEDTTFFRRVVEGGFTLERLQDSSGCCTSTISSESTFVEMGSDVDCVREMVRNVEFRMQSSEGQVQIFRISSGGQERSGMGQPVSALPSNED